MSENVPVSVKRHFIFFLATGHGGAFNLEGDHAAMDDGENRGQAGAHGS